MKIGGIYTYEKNDSSYVSIIMCIDDETVFHYEIDRTKTVFLDDREDVLLEISICVGFGFDEEKFKATSIYYYEDIIDGYLGQMSEDLFDKMYEEFYQSSAATRLRVY